MSTSTLTGSVTINSKAITYRYDLTGSTLIFSDGSTIPIMSVLKMIDFTKVYASSTHPVVVTTPPIVVTPPVVVVSPVVVTPPVTTGFNVALIPEELIATNIYDATSVLNASGKACADKESVMTFVDRKGGLNLTSQSPTLTPAYGGKLPWLIATERDTPSVYFFNTNDLNYNSSAFPVRTFPYAIRDIIELLPGQAYEGISDGGNPGDGYMPYKGIIGYGSARAGGSDPTYYSLPNTQLTLHTRLDWLTVYDGSTIKSYINGVLKDSIPMPAKSVNYVGMDAITKLNIGVSTNSAIFLFNSRMTYFGADYTNLMKDFENINTKIGAKWKVGEVNPNPHAWNPKNDDLTWTYNSKTGALTPTPTFVNCTDAQIEAAQYTWWAKFNHTAPEGSGAFTRMQPFSTSKIANASTLTGLKYTATTGGTMVGCTVTTPQSIFYTVSIPSYLEIKGASQDLPLTDNT